MAQYIDKATLVEEIKKAIKNIYAGREYVGIPYDEECIVRGFQKAEDIINTLEVKDSYEQCVQYDSIKAGIQAHAETYSFNIESELFNQLTKEQQKLWRKEIEQACISGGETGVELVKDQRYKENVEVKEMDLEKESLTWEDIPELLSISEQLKTSWWFRDKTKEIGTQVFWEEVLKRFKAQKGEKV